MYTAHRARMHTQAHGCTCAHAYTSTHAGRHRSLPHPQRNTRPPPPHPKQLAPQADLASVVEFKERQAEVEEGLMRLKEENQALTERLEQQRVELDR